MSLLNNALPGWMVERMALLAAIDKTTAEIAEYKEHAYCDSELDALFSAECALLEGYKDLLFPPEGIPPLLTDAGFGWVETAVKQIIACVTELAREHGLNIRKG